MHLPYSFERSLFQAVNCDRVPNLDRNKIRLGLSLLHASFAPYVPILFRRFPPLSYIKSDFNALSCLNFATLSLGSKVTSYFQNLQTECGNPQLGDRTMGVDSLSAITRQKMVAMAELVVRSTFQRSYKMKNSADEGLQ